MSKEQIYFELLTRTDHPVFARDGDQGTSPKSSLNSVFNRIWAQMLAEFREVQEEVRANTYPDTVTDLAIDDWEFEYFGFNKPQLDLQARVNELVIKVNQRVHMNLADCIALCRAITGLTPTITRNVGINGWVLGVGVLGQSTTLAVKDAGTNQGFYLVSFPSPVDSNLLKKLDDALTRIEKAGSRHRLRSPIQYWVLGKTALGVNTTLGA